MKKRKSEGDATPNANNVCLKQAIDRQEQAQLAIAKQVMTNRHILLVDKVATAKAVPPDKYADKYKISMFNRVTITSLTVRELEKKYGLEGMINVTIIDVDGKVIMGI